MLLAAGIRAIPQQLLHLAVVFVVAGTAFLVARRALTPETFGDLGHYRAAAIDSIAAHELRYAGHQDCSVCHGAINEDRLEGRHRGLSCETCHGPAAGHVANPVEVKPSAPRERAFCPLCHSYDVARPTGFPQIDPIAHNPRTPCITCHEPHEPEPPTVPEECSACHGQIARQKAVSHHATLPCVTCHEAPEEHKISPRAVRPTKPSERSFCGACHAQGSEGALRIPQIDLTRHNPEILCWQCHYPHYPEVGRP